MMFESALASPAIGEAVIRQILSGHRAVSLAAQPIVDLRRGIVTGYEALARFSLDVPTSPDLVFACADRVGLGEELEAYVLRLALELARDVPSNCYLAINVDPVHLTSPRVFDVIDEYGSLGGFVFELTEQRPIPDINAVARCLMELRKRGALTAVDDAGAGYSGLERILALRPQFIKIDRVLVRDLHRDEAKRAIVEMLGDMGARLDAWIVAEGIEDKADLHALAQLGVPLGQGNFLALPAPPWAPLSSVAKRALTGLPKAARANSDVADLVEPCATCSAQEAWPQVLGACVRLEGTGQAIALRITDETGERERASHELLRVKRTSGMAAVALRSAARCERLRWDPIVCVDELGHFEGIICVHKLVWALACRELDAGDSSGSYDSEIARAVAEQL